MNNSNAQASKINSNLAVMRNPAFDLLRVISLVGVIVMHVTSGIVEGVFSTNTDYLVKLIYNAPFHYGVPIFVMISGALFLAPGREINIKRLWKHNILRMIIVYFVWSTIYGLYDYMQYKASWKYIVWEIVNSRDHLWFLPMIIGIYAIVPILSTWIKNSSKKEIEYFIGLFLILQVICETIKVLPLPEITVYILALRNIQLVCSYVGYFVLGYYIIHIGIAQKRIKLIYVLGVLGAVMSVGATIGLAAYTKVTGFGIVDSFSILTFFWVIALFVWVNRLFDKNSCLIFEERDSSIEPHNSKINVVWAELGKDSFGAYLCHIAVIEILMSIGFSADSIPVVIGIPVYVIVIYIISSFIAAIIRRIPFIGRNIC